MYLLTTRVREIHFTGCDFGVGLFGFQVAPVVLPMTTATTATVTATTTLLLHIQTMR